MTVKLAILKSGEDVIADIQEMVVEDEETKQTRVVGYFFNKPCVVKVRKEENSKNVEIGLSSWIPLTKTKKIPITVDWVITLVDPIDQLLQMYEKDVLNHENDQNHIVTEQTSSDK